MNTEKPKVTLPLKVGQKVIWNYSKGATYPGRVVLTDLRNQDQCSVLVVYGADGGDEFAGRLLADGTLPGTAACLVWLTDPPDPREDLIPGQAIFVRDRDTDNWSIRLFQRVDPDGPGVFVTALGTECGDLVSYRYWKPYVAPTKELNVETEMSDTTKTPRAHAAMTTPHHDDSGSVSSPPKPRWMPFTPPKPSQHPDGYCDPVKARPVE